MGSTDRPTDASASPPHPRPISTPPTEIASEGLKGRVFEVNLAELQGGDEEQGYRKFKLVAEDVKGTDILTNFHGMDLTREKINSLIKKWQTLIDAHVEAKTTDGYTLRLVRTACCVHASCCLLAVLPCVCPVPGLA